MFKNITSPDVPNQPVYYHRDYEHDIPKGGMEESYVKRIALTALPFIALYRPAGWAFSISMDSLRGVSSLSDAATACQQTDIGNIAKSVLQVGIAVAALTATIFMHPIGLLVTTGSDIFIYSFQGAKALYIGDYKNFLECGGNLANSGIYLAMLTTNSLALVIFSLSMQLGVEGYKSIKELKKEHYIEVFGHLLMACLRTSQLHSQLQLIQLQNNLDRKASSYTEQLKEPNCPPEKIKGSSPVHISNEAFLKQVNDVIKKGDLEAFTQLQDSDAWKNLSQKDLGQLTYTLMNCFMDNQCNQNRISLVMLEAIVFQHPNSDQSIKRLMGLVKSSCEFGNTDLFKFLINKSSIRENLTDKYLLKFLSELNSSFSCHGGVFQDNFKVRKGEILKLLIQLPKWNRDSPEFLETALIKLIGHGYIPQAQRMEVIQEFEVYPSWEKLNGEALTRIASSKSINFISGTDEMSWFIFKILNKHTSWNDIGCENLSKIAQRISSSYVNHSCPGASLTRVNIMKILTQHSKWNALETKHLMDIAIPIALAGYGGEEILMLLSHHPNWDKMPLSQFYWVTWDFFHKAASAELLMILEKHQSWLAFNKIALAEFAGMAANRNRPDLLQVLANHPNWSQLDKKDVLDILKWSYWSWEISGILEVLSKLPAWGKITRNDLQVYGLEDWYDKF